MLKEKILAMLVDAGDSPLSGEKMAQECGVSRNAVWKGIKSLREEGYQIEAATRAGYQLKSEKDIFTLTGLCDTLGEEAPFQIHYQQRVSSTNDMLKTMAEEEIRPWTVMIADEQSSGRGRMGRHFYSPSGSGIYMSVLLQPDYGAYESSLLTLAAAVAVAESIEVLSGQDVGIKWVNDCYLGSKKCAGILTEAALSMEDQRLRYAIVGMGINVYAPKEGFPEEIAQRAGAIYGYHEQIQGQRNQLAAEILTRFYDYAEDLLERKYLAHYEARLNMLHRPITLVRGGEEEIVEALGINDRGNLKVRYDNGTESFIHSGEVRVIL